MTKYSDNRPPLGRTVVAPGARRPAAKSDDPLANLSAETIAALKQVVREDTGVHRLRNREITSSVQSILSEWRAKNRNSFIKTAVSAVGALIVTLGGYGAYNARTEKPQPATKEVVTEAIESNAGEMTKRVDANAARIEQSDKVIRNVGKAVLELEETLVATEKHLSAKLDAISAKARKVKPNAKVQEARERADSKSDATRFDERFDPKGD